MAKWKVTALPGGKNPDEKGRTATGLVVYLTDGVSKHEVARVAFVRKHALNPKAAFRKQLAEEMDKAEAAAETMNKLYARDYGSSVGV